MFEYSELDEGSASARDQDNIAYHINLSYRLEKGGLLSASSARSARKRRQVPGDR